MSLIWENEVRCCISWYWGLLRLSHNLSRSARSNFLISQLVLQDISWLLSWAPSIRRHVHWLTVTKEHNPVHSFRPDSTILFQHSLSLRFCWLCLKNCILLTFHRFFFSSRRYLIPRFTVHFRAIYNLVDEPLLCRDTNREILMVPIKIQNFYLVC